MSALILISYSRFVQASSFVHCSFYCIQFQFSFQLLLFHRIRAPSARSIWLDSFHAFAGQFVYQEYVKIEVLFLACKRLLLICPLLPRRHHPFSPLLLPQQPFFHSSPTSATLLLCLSFVYNPSTLPLFCPKPFFLASPSLPTLLLLLPPFAAPSLLCCCPCSGAW